MARFLFFSDLHAHNFQQFAKISNSGVNTRLLITLSCLDKIKRIIIDKKVDTVFFLGDMFHGHTTVEHDCYNLTLNYFKELCENTPMYSIYGQHDIGTKRKNFNIAQAAFSSYIPNFHLYTSSVIDIKGVNTYFRSYSKDVPKEPPIADIGCFHFPLKGVDYGGFVSKEGFDIDVVKDNYKWVFLGDCHKPSRQGNVIVVGSILPQSFADVDIPRGVWILDTEKNDVEFVEVESPRFITVEKKEEIKEDDNNYRVIPKLAKTKINPLSNVNLSFSQWLSKRKYSDVVVEFATKLLKDTKIFGDSLVPQGWAIKSVHLKNFTVHEDFKYEHFETGLHGIFGENGSGKTSVFDAINWCLFGLISKDKVTQDEVSKDKKGNCSVETVLSKDNSILEITRYRRHKKFKNDLIIKYDNQTYTGIKETTIMLKQLLGMDDEFFNYCVYISQEGTQFFSSVGEATRGRIISGILNISRYDVILSKVNKEIRGFENKIMELDSQSRILIEQEERLSRICEDIFLRVDKITTEQLTEITGNIATKEQEKKRLSNKLKPINKLLDGLCTLRYDAKEAIGVSRSKMKSVPEDEGCPLIPEGIELPGICPLTESWKEKYKEDCEERVGKYTNNYMAIETEVSRVKLEQEIIIKEWNRLGSEIIRFNSDRSILDGKLQGLEQQKGVEDEVGKIKKQIKENRWMVEKSRRSLEIYKECREIFGKTGFRVELMRLFFEIFNMYWGLYIKGFKVEFKVDENGKTELDLDGVRKYRNLSGGEKKVFDIACLLALNHVIIDIHGLSSIPLGFVAMDEVFSFLDDRKEEMVIEMFKTFIERSKASVNVITHSSGLKSYFNSITYLGE